MSAATVWVASDHAGFELKAKILEMLALKANSLSYSYKDLGPFNEERVDYPDFADLVAQKVTQNTQDLGVLVCGSGQGMAIRANRYPKVRAALVWSPEVTQLSRQHNDANILCLGGRVLDHHLALQLVELFLTTPFEGGRHKDRVTKLSKPCS